MMPPSLDFFDIAIIGGGVGWPVGRFSHWRRQRGSGGTDALIGNLSKT